jgi:hypothetical protein
MVNAIHKSAFLAAEYRRCDSISLCGSSLLAATMAAPPLLHF